MKSLIVKHSIIVSGRKTSVTLEYVFWESLRELAKKRGISRSELISFEASATEIEYTDTDPLWELLDRTKADFQGTLEAIAAVRDEAAGVRVADVETIRTCFSMTSAQGRELSAQLVILLGEGAFTDEALCK